MIRRSARVFVAVAFALTSGACGDDEPTGSAPRADEGVRVASFDFAESVLLAEMYAQVVESTGTPVVRLGAIGPREIVAPAMELGRIDLVPEYLGTALLYAGEDDPTHDTTDGVELLQERLDAKGLTVLEPAPAEDKNVFAVTSEMAERAHLENVSDLKMLDQALLFGGTAECPDRPLCLLGLESVYELEFADFVPQPSLAFTAEALRRAEIDVGLMFSTAAELVAFDLVALGDDRHLQPAENVIPVLRSDALERWGTDLVDALNAMSARLTTRELRFLNVHVMNEVPVEEVARDWLTTKRLLG